MHVITDDRCWTLLDNEELAGFMMLDFRGDVEEVIICPPWAKYAVVQRQRTLKVLQVVTTYVLLYAAGRLQEFSFGNPQADSSSNVPALRSQEATVLPEITSKSIEELTDGLTRWGKNIVIGETETLVAIANRVCLSLEMGITFALSAQQTVPDYHIVTFIAPEGRYFCGWMHLEAGRDEIPSAHPLSQQAQQAVLVNGYTDSPISGEAVRRIYAPTGSYSYATGISTWQYVDHPFCGAGDHIDLEVSFKALASHKGMQELQGVLSALLGLHGMYVGVLGGFSG